MKLSRLIIKPLIDEIASIFLDFLPDAENPTTTTRFHFMYLVELSRFLEKPQLIDHHQSQKWIEILRETQQPNGYFTADNQAGSYLLLTDSALSIHTLQLLDRDIKFPIYTAKEFADRHQSVDWFEQIDHFVKRSDFSVHKAIQSGKTVLDMATLLYKAYRDGIISPDTIDYFFNCCDSHADPVSGLWTPDSTESNRYGLIDACYRAQAYYFWKRKFPYPKQMIQTILALQRRSGHFIDKKNDYLISDFAAVTLLSGILTQENLFRFRITRSIKRVLKSWSKIILEKSAPNLDAFFQHGWTCEIMELNDIGDFRLYQIIAALYLSAIQIVGLKTIGAEETFPGKKRSDSPSPCFTFTPEMSENNGSSALFY